MKVSCIYSHFQGTYTRVPVKLVPAIRQRMTDDRLVRLIWRRELFPDASENVEGWGLRWLQSRREKRKKGLEWNVSEIDCGVRINRVIRICYISKCEKGFYFGGVDAKWWTKKQSGEHCFGARFSRFHVGYVKWVLRVDTRLQDELKFDLCRLCSHIVEDYNIVNLDNNLGNWAVLFVS